MKIRITFAENEAAGDACYAQVGEGRCPDGWPIDMSPLGWARHCRRGDDYCFVSRGMAPLTDAELDAIADVCARRGLELFGGDDGLHVEKLND